MKTLYFISYLFLTILTTACSNQNNKNQDPLTGYWKLKDFWVQEQGDFWKIHPWMRNGNGYLLYDGSGHMSIHITPAWYDTAVVFNQNVQEVFSKESNIHTLANYAYTGTYEFSGKDSVIHHALSHCNPKENFSSSPKKFEIIRNSLFLYSKIANKHYKIHWIKTP